jgi:uncharacterized protein involved in type VI secretion and phage assembly
MSNGNTKRYFGKYRGVVTNNRDPMMLGRIQAKVQDVLGDQESSWAMPCTPYGGRNVGLFLIPPVNALVWIEFEHGDPDYPIWTGCFWASGEVPASPAVAEMKVLKTDVGTITLNDQPGSGGITIETTGGLKIEMNTEGIAISNGSQKVELSSASVSINDGALEVM